VQYIPWEAVPFFAGAGLRLVLSAVLQERPPHAISVVMSVLLGLGIAWLMGELAGDLWTAVGATVLDSIAAAVGWISADVLVSRWQTTRKRVSLPK
jgi:hypothetical protein